MTRASHIDPEATYPIKTWWALPISLGLIFLEVVYFYYLVRYDAIPGITVFWIAFACWAAPPVLGNWRYRNIPMKRQVDKFGNLFIGFGIAGLFVAVVARRLDPLLPVAYAIMPGAMAGGLAATIMTALWSGRKSDGTKRGTGQTRDSTLTDY